MLMLENTDVSSFERNIRVTEQGVKSEGEKIILLKCCPLFVGLSSFSASMSMIRNEEFAIYSGLQNFLQNNFSWVQLYLGIMNVFRGAKHGQVRQTCDIYVCLGIQRWNMPVPNSPRHLQQLFRLTSKWWLE